MGNEPSILTEKSGIVNLSTVGIGHSNNSDGKSFRID